MSIEDIYDSVWADVHLTKYTPHLTLKGRIARGQDVSEEVQNKINRFKSFSQKETKK